MVCLSRLYYFKFYTGVFHKFHLVSFGELSLVVSDLHSETKDSRLLGMRRGERITHLISNRPANV